MITAMTTNEALALARLRQWASLRVTNKYGKTWTIRNGGWQRRDERCFNAGLVRVIDFDRALNTLEEEEKVALVLSVRDREPSYKIARALGCSERKVSYLIPQARRKLAATLDRLDLL